MSIPSYGGVPVRFRGMITEQQWDSFCENGFVKLGKVLSADELAGLQDRIDEIMLGTAEVDYDRLLMQLDGTGTQQSKGFKRPTLDYRKIQDLELDSRYLDYMRKPIFADLCQRVYGDVAISAFRAMFMNKPAGAGTRLRWHQDRWTALDRDPLLTVWTALDPATVANGCVQIVPGSHKFGLINPSDPSGFLTDEQATKHCPPEKVVYLELAAGAVVVLHNWLLHASEVNRTEIPRRAFSVCYMDARTEHANGTDSFTTVFGAAAASTS